MLRAASKKDLSTRVTVNLMDAVQRSLYSGTPLLGQAPNQDREEHVSSARKALCSLRRLQAAAKIHQFKVDTTFFAKHPGVYDPDAVGKGAANKSINYATVQFPLPFTNSSAQAYLTTAMQSVEST